MSSGLHRLVRAVVVHGRRVEGEVGRHSRGGPQDIGHWKLVTPCGAARRGEGAAGFSGALAAGVMAAFLQVAPSPWAGTRAGGLWWNFSTQVWRSERSLLLRVRLQSEQLRALRGSHGRKLVCIYGPWCRLHADLLSFRFAEGKWGGTYEGARAFFGRTVTS